MSSVCRKCGADIAERGHWPYCPWPWNPDGPQLALVDNRITDTQRMDHMQQTKRYPFPNVGKWTMRVGPEKSGGHWVHGATLRECLDAAITASRGLPK